MKKPIILVLATLLLLGITACSGKRTDATQTVSPSGASGEPSVPETPAASSVTSSGESHDADWLDYKTVGTTVTVTVNLPVLTNSAVSVLLLRELSDEADFENKALDIDQIVTDEKGYAQFTLILPEDCTSGYLVLNGQGGRYTARIDANR